MSTELFLNIFPNGRHFLLKKILVRFYLPNNLAPSETS
jgi:hypothetical protein